MKQKYFFATAMFLLVSVFCYSQENDSEDSVYKKTSFPQFSVVTPDSVWVTNKSFPAGKPLIFIYFSPDCGHCQLEAQAMYKNIDSFKNATVLWVSFHPLPEIKMFKTLYHLDSLPNVIFARDPKYFLPAYYKVAFTPYIAVYNSEGIFVKGFRTGAKPEELIQAIK